VTCNTQRWVYDADVTGAGSTPATGANQNNTNMTKQEWLQRIDELANACRSFQGEYAMDETDNLPEPIEEIWNLCEDIVMWSEGGWRTKW
jgi:hypothetical protein